MPLLNKYLLQKAIDNHPEIYTDARRETLVKLFRDTLSRIESGKFKKEESEKVPFLQKLFESLGYRLHDNLEFEYSTPFRGSIDGVLGYPEPDGSTPEKGQGRNVEVAIEWKGIDTKDLDKGKAGETPIDQLFRYMGNTRAEFGLVGNFLEFRLYSWNKRKDKYQKFKLAELAENKDHLKQFMVLLFPDFALKKGGDKSKLEELLEKSEAEQEQITKDFYNDYKQRRLNLFGHLVENNPVADDSSLHHNNHGKQELSSTAHKIFLLEKSQKILDRLIFVMFCEDGFLLPNNIFKDTYTLAKNSRSRSETKIWEEFKYLFEDIDKGRYDVNPQINAFNGGLFAEDLELNNLVIKNEVWEWFNQISEKYDFESDLNVNILGHIFEQSISDIEELKEEIEDYPEPNGSPLDRGTKKTSKRKKDGIYYTPEYITDYIVSETVNNWLADQKNSHLDGQPQVDEVFPLQNIKILDPAGGSGAFPNQVHNYLTKKHEAKFKELSTDQNDLFNQVQIDKSILKNNIFMVDLQPESVEIAKLSLWLKTAKKDQKLNNLDENVKCGNSLIDDPEIAGDLAFDWEKEFGWVRGEKNFKKDEN